MDNINNIFIKSAKNPLSLKASEVVLDLKDVGQISLGFPVLPNTRTLFHDLENLNLLLSGDEYDCNQRHGSRQTCLVWWPTEKDIIWHANINITSQEVLCSESLSKRVE